MVIHDDQVAGLWHFPSISQADIIPYQSHTYINPPDLGLSPAPPTSSPPTSPPSLLLQQPDSGFAVRDPIQGMSMRSIR